MLILGLDLLAAVHVFCVSSVASAMHQYKDASGSSFLIGLGFAAVLHTESVRIATLTDHMMLDVWSGMPMQVARLGVTSIHVPSGMSCQVFQQGLQEHAKLQPGG